ncbi:MAG: hypothetical protein JEZ07_11805 [Phycisphaerae bacterium]|nr:hypothetical protein [Phycisphaerae bacterium]
MKAKKEANRRGQLYKYISNDESYNCPSDRRQFDNSKNSWRTYSIMGGLNSPEMPSITLIKTSQIATPSDKLVFLEEIDPRGWNMNSWNFNDPFNHNDYRWVDFPGSFHRDSITFGWGDGHASSYKWKNENTILLHKDALAGLVEPTGNMSPSSKYCVDNEDILYLKRHWPRKKGQSISH